MRTNKIVRRLVILVVMATLAACLPVPVGDPDKSKIDQKYLGVWEWRDDNSGLHLAIFRAYDDRTYFVDTITAEMADGTVIKATSRSGFKGWLTAVKGETFLTLQPLETVSTLPGEKRQKTFILAKVKIEGDLLTARGVDPNYKGIKDIGTATEMQRFIEAKMDDTDLFVKPIKATKWAEDQLPRLEKIDQSFANKKE